MNFSVRAGAIIVEAALADGHVRAVTIHSSRPAGLGRIFLGHLSEDVPALAERLFALCGFSHRVAATQAIAVAQQKEIPFADAFNAGIGLLAERIEDSLRSVLLGWPHGNRLTELNAARHLFRQAGACTQELLNKARLGRCFHERRRLLGLLDDLKETLGKLGIYRIKADTMLQDDFFAVLAADVTDEKIPLRCPDTLQRTDDEAVVAALIEAGESFASLPALPGRLIETGAFARCWKEVSETQNGLLARLQARMLDVSRAEESLRASLKNGEAVQGLIDTRCFDEGHAYAAVETPRGRLYHQVSLSLDDRIETYNILAPTEWNLHPQGALQHNLLGAHVGSGDNARASIARLTSLFDPCVAFQVHCKDVGHA